MAHVSFPDSITVADGLMFTVGQITWTTGPGGFVNTLMEEVQIQSTPTASALVPATTTSSRPPLPRYKGRRIDNTDLLDAIDRIGFKIQETMNLVDSIRDQSNELVPACHNRSPRSVRNSHSTWLGTDLVVTSTPEGRFVQSRPVPSSGRGSPNNSPRTRGPRRYPMVWLTLRLTTHVLSSPCSQALRIMLRIQPLRIYLRGRHATPSTWSSSEIIRAPRTAP